MDRKLSDAKLRDGTPVEVRLVMPPEPAWAEKVDRFLSHKGMPWQIHWRAAFAGQCDDLQTRFYLLVVDGRPISNIMMVENMGIGILGHVYTDPAWRQKGAATILMRTVCDDFASRSGIALYLYTEYASMPWRLYEKFGFRGIVPQQGYMQWVRQEDALKALLYGEGLQVRAVAWRDWPCLECLFLQGQGDWLKNFALKRFGTCDMEHAFLVLQSKKDKDARVAAAVLTNASGMTVGLATIMPIEAWPSRYLLCDVYAHPAAEAGLEGLLEEVLSRTDSPMLSILDAPSKARQAALSGQKFETVASLPSALTVNGDDRNMLIMVRR